MPDARWLLAAVGLAAPLPAAAQRGWDAQVHAIGVVSDSSFFGLGAGVGLRAGRGVGLGATTSAGWLAPDRIAGRAELLVYYHLPATRPGRPGVYGGAGVAADAREDDLRGLAVVVIGVEAPPARQGGWFVEVGVGGGLRLAAGYRAIRLRSGPE